MRENELTLLLLLDTALGLAGGLLLRHLDCFSLYIGDLRVWSGRRLC